MATTFCSGCLHRISQMPVWGAPLRVSTADHVCLTCIQAEGMGSGKKQDIIGNPDRCLSLAAKD